MSKKLKFFVGSLAIAAVAILATGKASAAYMQTMTLKMGMTNSQVMSLQQTLNMTSCKVSMSGTGSMGMESMYFGTKTKAAVQCFQAANGLKADGVVGPMTGAALAAVTGSTTVNIGLPAGCTTTTGYSTTTGAPCSGTPTGTWPAGCVSSTGFSSTTGMPCNGTSTGVSTSGPLSINSVTANSGYANTNVGVGASNVQVADLRIVTGAGGSGNLTGVNLTFTNAGSGDFQFTKYASNVSVWYNGVQVGSLPTSSFSLYNSAFSAFVPISGAMLNPNTTSDLYVAVSAQSSIDSLQLDTTHNNFAISSVTLRYSDATGSSFQVTPSTTGSIVGAGSTVTNALPNTNFTFSNAATAGNIKLNVTKDTNDATDRSVQVSSSSTTQSVTLATIDLNAQNSALALSKLPVTIGVGPAISDVSTVVSTVRLFNSAGTQIDSESIPVNSTTACPSGSSLYGVGTSKCVTINFQNFANNGSQYGYSLASGANNVFTIKADINSAGVSNANYAAGTYAVAELTPANVLAIQAYDANNNLLTQNNTNLTGSTTGSKVSFYINGVSVMTNGTPTNIYANGVSGVNSGHGTFTMTIPFSVTAYGQTAYVPSQALYTTSGTVNSPTPGTGAYVYYAVDNGSSLQGSGSNPNATLTYTGSDNLTVDTNGNYIIPVGQTKTFNLTISYSPSALGQYRAQLVSVNYNLNDSSSTYNTYTSGLTSNQFRTGYVTGQ